MCVCVCRKGQRWMPGIFLGYSPHYLRPEHIFYSLALGAQYLASWYYRRAATTTQLFLGSGDVNCGPHTCAAST